MKRGLPDEVRVSRAVPRVVPGKYAERGDAMSYSLPGYRVSLL